MVDLGVSPPQHVLEEWAILAGDGHDSETVSRNTILLMLCVFIEIVTVLSVAGRFWLRAFVERKMDLSDWLSQLVVVGGLSFR